jgi:hypothetical protein
MIIDFKRHYVTLQQFTELNGSECSLCKTPHTVTPPEIYTQTVSCSACGWKLEFERDIYANQRSRMFSYKNLSFWYGIGDEKLYIRDTKDVSYSWGVFENKRSILSLRAILELIRSGACREACLQIRKANAIRLKKAAEAAAKKAIEDAAALAAALAAANAQVAAAINDVQVAVAA